MKWLLHVIFFLVISLSLRSQSFSDEVLKEKFAFEVIQLDEFMERFNFDKDTRLIRYMQEEYGEQHNLNRSVFLKSLFKENSSKFNEILIKEFIQVVTDTNAPILLSFYDKDWYAELSCTFEYLDNIIPVTLIMSNQLTSDSASKWVIESVYSSELELPDSEDENQIIPPVSYGVDFIGLFNFLEDHRNLKNYIDKDFTMDPMTYFVSLLYFGEAKLISIDSIRYHFLQVPHWIFSVQYFNVPDLQSGWLISDLFRVNDRGKNKFRKECLNL